MAKTLCFQEVRRDFGHAVSSFIVFVPVQPFSADADLLAPFQPELFLHHCTEMRLTLRNAACHSAQTLTSGTTRDFPAVTQNSPDNRPGCSLPTPSRGEVFRRPTATPAEECTLAGTTGFCHTSGCSPMKLHRPKDTIRTLADPYADGQCQA